MLKVRSGVKLRLGPYPAVVWPRVDHKPEGFESLGLKFGTTFEGFEAYLFLAHPDFVLGPG